MERATTVDRIPAIPREESRAAPAGGLPDLGILGWLRCDGEGLIKETNTALASWLGAKAPESLAGRPLESFLGDASLLPDWTGRQKPFTCRFELQTPGDRQLPVHAEIHTATGAPGLELWIVADMANDLIARVARLEAAHTLTAGTVHDVNNLMTVLSGNLFLLTEGVRDDPKLCEQARRARNAASRGSTLLRELLTFSRGADAEAKAINPGDHARSLTPLLLRTVRSGASEHELKVSVDENAGSTIASAAQFESALINLVINARDALRPGGRVHVRVSNRTVDDERAARLGVSTGEYVCTSVSDNGSGIPEKHLLRVTEPLFTTKRADRGSGLGLSMVRHFAEKYRGALSIDSVEGRGTRIGIWLPCTEKLAETTANMTLPLSTLPGGNERLMLMSRDRDVRASMQQILEALGYTVVSAESAEDVDRLLAKSAAPDCLVSERLLAALQVERRWLGDLARRYPNMRHVALLQAGTKAAEAAPDADGHLFRPIIIAELARTIRNALEKS